MTLSAQVLAAGAVEGEPKFVKFTCFGRLPLELRRMILKEAALVPRVTTLRLGVYMVNDKCCLGQAPSKQPILPLLVTSKECREVALSYSKTVFESSSMMGGAFDNGDSQYEHERTHLARSKILHRPNDTLFIQWIPDENLRTDKDLRTHKLEPLSAFQTGHGLRVAICSKGFVH